MSKNKSFGLHSDILQQSIAGSAGTTKAAEKRVVKGAMKPKKSKAKSFTDFIRGSK